MPEGSGIGVYPYGEVADPRENDEVSSTYEGRHLTFLEADITGHEHTWPTKGHPVVVGENIVGVVLAIERTDGTIGAAANAVTDHITIDTEGIFLQSVVSVGVAVVAGDELFINKTTAIISNTYNKNTHAHFGYALGGVTVGNTAIISVKVHWDPDDELEAVGANGDEVASAIAGKIFREYHYELTGGGFPFCGDYLSLKLSTVRANYGAACIRRLELPGDADMNGGWCAPMECKLEIIGAGNAIQHGMGVIALSYYSQSTLSINNFQCSFIRLHDHTGVASYMMPRLLDFASEPAAIRDAGVDDDRILVDSANDQVSNIRIRCGRGPNSTPFWIMCTDQAPT